MIQIFTADGQPPDRMRGSIVYGSFGNLKAGIDALGAAGPFDYNVDFTHFQVDGFRAHSSAKNESFNGKLNYSLNDRSRLTLLAGLVARPDAQDPLGLTPQEFAANPYQTDAAALTFNTRKSLQQQQGGLIYDLDISPVSACVCSGAGGRRRRRTRPFSPSRRARSARPPARVAWWVWEPPVLVARCRRWR